MGSSNQRVSFLLCLLLAVVPVMAIDMPKALAVYPGLIGVIFYCVYRYSLKVPLVFSKGVLALCGSIFGLASLSLLWALHFDTSLKQVTTFMMLLPPQIFLISLAARLPREHVAPYLYYYAYAIGLGSLLMMLETYWGGIAFNLIHQRPLDVPAETYEYNRGAVLMVMCSFGALAVLREKFNNKFMPLIMLVPLVIALFFSESQSAQLMFIVGFAALFFFPYKYKIAWRLMKAGILFAMLAMPFIVMFGFHHITSDVANITILKDANVGPRLEIWDYISRYALEQPLSGYGVDVTRSVTDFDCHFIFNLLKTVTHPHNFILQIWIEFGLPGILIAMGLMYQLLTMIQTRFTITQQKILLPTFLVTLLASSTAYGMWQGMWMGAQFYAAAMAILAAKTIEKPTSI